MWDQHIIEVSPQEETVRSAKSVTTDVVASWRIEAHESKPRLDGIQEYATFTVYISLQPFVAASNTNQNDARGSAALQDDFEEKSVRTAFRTYSLLHQWLLHGFRKRGKHFVEQTKRTRIQYKVRKSVVRKNFQTCLLGVPAVATPSSKTPGNRFQRRRSRSLQQGALAGDGHRGHVSSAGRDEGAERCQWKISYTRSQGKKEKKTARVTTLDVQHPRRHDGQHKDTACSHGKQTRTTKESTGTPSGKGQDGSRRRHGTFSGDSFSRVSKLHGRKARNGGHKPPPAKMANPTCTTGGPQLSWTWHIRVGNIDSSQVVKPVLTCELRLMDVACHHPMDMQQRFSEEGVSDQSSDSSTFGLVALLRAASLDPTYEWDRNAKVVDTLFSLYGCARHASPLGEDLQASTTYHGEKSDWANRRIHQTLWARWRLVRLLLQRARQAKRSFIVALYVAVNALWLFRFHDERVAQQDHKGARGKLTFARHDLEFKGTLAKQRGSHVSSIKWSGRLGSACRISPLYVYLEIAPRGWHPGRDLARDLALQEVIKQRCFIIGILGGSNTSNSASDTIDQHRHPIQGDEHLAHARLDLGGENGQGGQKNAGSHENPQFPVELKEEWMQGLTRRWERQWRPTTQ
ncbi:hypothetical protein EDD15DRAFT_2202809 [Pisolithus albus]|nr:hypothetical protein EDD15DRAFT_2202809 [Pisolithus albus]